MRITDSNQLLAQLDAGANLKLEDGIVKTECGLAHAVRKLGDFFRSFTAAGREAIRTRSENLRAAMGDLLRSGMDQELARAASLPDVQAMRTRKGFAGALARMRMARDFRAMGVADLPRAFRTLDVLKAMGVADLPRAFRALDVLKSRGVPTKIARKVVEFCAAPRTEADLRAMRECLTTDLVQGWQKREKAHVERPDSIHNNWSRDMKRGFISTINGRPPDTDFRRQIIDLIPNPAVRGFITFLTCQAGVAGSITTGIWEKNADLHSFSKDGDDHAVTHGMVPKTDQHMDLRIEDGVAIITCSQDILLAHTDMRMDGQRYEEELRIPLDQDVPEGGIPQFEITSLTCTPILRDIPADAERARRA